MSLYFITGNISKFTEVRNMLGDVLQLDLDLPELQTLDAQEIIRAKLQEARKHHQGAFIVEDTSLYFDALNGLPGPLIKWFLQTVGNAELYRIVAAFGNFSAQAKTIIGYADEQGVIAYFEGVVKGRIVSPRGETDFGWDPIFEPEGWDKTFAELSAVEKNMLSMRRIAVDGLKKYLDAL